MSDSDFVNSLAARRPGLEQLEPVWRMLDDVLAGNLKRRGAPPGDGRGAGWRSPYLPKGRLEPESEYSLRIELTPFFPQTPQILASRLGALFKQRMQVEFAPGQPTGSRQPTEAARGTGRLERFLKAAGRRHASFEDLAAQAACLAQVHGFCAALLDRDPLPEDVRGTSHHRDAETQRTDRKEEAGSTAGPARSGTAEDGGSTRPVSQAEAAARNLGRPYLALYAAPEILDWDFGSDGRLAWVKFGEEELWRRRWDARPEFHHVYRIVDREKIAVYRARRYSDGEWRVLAEPPVPHGCAARVPVVFLHPFPAQDGIGRPILQRAAEADIAATRVLSDLVWDLFLLGNPILTLKTSRREEDLAKLGLGATRYIPLRNGTPNVENPEELAFVKLDPAGIELLFRAHALFASQAAKLSGGEEAAVPREQSGVAQAWRFKTGEERVLFLLARALEPFLAECLELADCGLRIGDCGLASGAPADEGARGIVVRLPESFDVAPAGEALDTAEKVLAVAERLGQPELARAALRRIEAALGTLPGETRAALAGEREKLEITAETQRRGDGRE